MSDLTVPSPSVPTSLPSQVAAPKAVAPKVVSVPSASAPPTNPVVKSEVANTTSGTNIASKSNKIEAPISTSAAPTGASNILTFRDNDTGRLIIKLIDKDNNAVITQFPSLTQLGNYPKVNVSPVQVRTVDEEI
ncbi:MAG: hypothetical protein V7776_17465 [Halopseudomonas aestusnigri]